MANSVWRRLFFLSFYSVCQRKRSSLPLRARRVCVQEALGQHTLGNGTSVLLHIEHEVDIISIISCIFDAPSHFLLFLPTRRNWFSSRTRSHWSDRGDKNVLPWMCTLVACIRYVGLFYIAHKLISVSLRSVCVCVFSYDDRTLQLTWQSGGKSALRGRGRMKRRWSFTPQ